MNLEKKSRKMIFKFFLIAVVMIAILIPWTEIGKSKDARLNGTFIQLTSDHLDWEIEQWEDLFEYFQRMRLNHVIVQWTVYDHVNFFDNPVEDSPLGIILGLADTAEMNVDIGLLMDSIYWKKIEEGPDQIKAYFDETLVLTKQLADQIYEHAAEHACFQGWYISQEIDDVHWMADESQQILFQYLKELTSYLHNISPDKHISISGFASAQVSSEMLEELWTKLLTATRIDRVLFQDGVGIKNIQPKIPPVYFKSMSKAVKAMSREFYIIIEVFEQIAGNPLNSDQFQAIPASWHRVRKQLEVGTLYADNLIAFSVPEYMTPMGGVRAEKLYVSYLQFIE